jgi:hypothetical protein
METTTYQYGFMLDGKLLHAVEVPGSEVYDYVVQEAAKGEASPRSTTKYKLVLPNTPTSKVWTTADGTTLIGMCLKPEDYRANYKDARPVVIISKLSPSTLHTDVEYKDAIIPMMLPIGRQIVDTMTAGRFTKRKLHTYWCPAVKEGDTYTSQMEVGKVYYETYGVESMLYLCVAHLNAAESLLLELEGPIELAETLMYGLPRSKSVGTFSEAEFTQSMESLPGIEDYTATWTATLTQ